MKIFTTNCSLLWNKDISVLENYKEDIIMINMSSSKAVQNNFTTIDVQCIKDWVGINSEEYKALLSVSDKIKQYVSYNEDVLILSDSDPRTLYTFKILQSISYQLPLKLHLWALLPFGFEGQRRDKICKSLLFDLSSVKSLILFNANDYLEKIDKRMTMSDAFYFIGKNFTSLLPQVIDEIKHMNADCKYFFDTITHHFINIQNNSLTLSNYNESVQETIISNEPKINGKEICDKLRKMRIDFAEANNIDFSSEPCQYNGPCSGTCEKCEQELAYLNQQTQTLDDITYPHNEIEQNYKLSNLEEEIDLSRVTMGFLRKHKE